MQIFAPNIFVIGDEIFELDSPQGKPNPAAAARQYESEIMALRAKIKTQPFGARWLEIVGNNVEPISIVPASSTRDAVAQTFPNIPQHSDRLADAQARGFSPQATGRGTPIRVKFNLATSVGSMAGAASGEVLLMHELTHAYRSASGHFAPVSMAGLIEPQRQRANPQLVHRFPDFEEWLAVVVENVFAAESGRSILRTHWDVLHPASATSPAYFEFWNISTVGKQTDSQEFAEDYRPAILHMQRVEPALFSAMQASRAWFNPVRDYVESLLARRG